MADGSGPGIGEQQVTGREVTFGTEEIIVSKTDRTGRLTYVNSTFLRIAGYTAEELIGQPHNIIRHPAMPRGVFKLLWDTIQNGREIFAYVVNRTKCGDHYWVFAHVTPSFGADGSLLGFHSNRRCPDRAQIAKVAPLYEAMVAEEQRHSRKVDAIAASSRILERAVAERHRSYEEFVFSL